MKERFKSLCIDFGECLPHTVDSYDVLCNSFTVNVILDLLLVLN